MSGKTQEQRSLSEVHGTVAVPVAKGWRRLLAFLGPAYLVSVGYMDPGNWATDIAGGSAFGYKLLWVLLMSNLMALLLQSLSARLGIVRGLDLAQASRHTYPPWVNLPLYVLAEIAIAACDLAEVIGMAIGLHLLFGLPMLAGVLITAADALVILFLMHRGMRVLEVFIISIVSIIGLSFLAEMFIVQPNMGDLVKGFIPSGLEGDALYIAIGIIGATVMPHNLYLHSSLVQTRKHGRDAKGIREALRFNFIDTTVALNIAFLVNGAILVLAAAAFHTSGHTQVAEMDQAHGLLRELFGGLAPALFAVALIGSGQSSTITGTLAGQIVMEGYLDLRIRPWLRRLLTRIIAIVPAVLCIVWFGEEALGELLVLSQVVLSLQLGFAVVPLIHFCSDRRHMGEHTIKPWVRVLAWASALIIVGLNARLVFQFIAENLGDGSGAPAWVPYLVVPIVAGAFLLLLYVAIKPFFRPDGTRPGRQLHGDVPVLEVPAARKPSRICIAVDFSEVDKRSVEAAIAQGGLEATYVLIHVTESAAARYAGEDSLDHETVGDRNTLQVYVDQLSRLGYKASAKVGHGHSVRAIARIVNDMECDLLVMGGHGHRGFKDILLGATVDAVRHRVRVPVLIVR